MQTAVKSDFVSVEDYLAAEKKSDVRHEYLGGLVYAMAGETRQHNRIRNNVYFALRQRIGTGPCEIYVGDIRVNFDIRDDDYFYYPDIVVTCDKRDNDKLFVRHPKVIIEILSDSTERVDRREKFFAYRNMPSLEEYVLVPQESREVTVFRRSKGWKAETVAFAKGVVSFASLKSKVPMSAIYEGI